MAYNSNKGTQNFGDIHYDGDPAETQIDFEDDLIALKTNNIQRLIVSASAITASAIFSASSGIYAGTFNGTTISGSSHLQAGGNLTVAGNVGIGTTSPAGKLHVKSSGNSTYPLYIEASDGSNLGGMYQGGSGNGSFYVRDADGSAKTILQSLGASSFLGGGIATVGDITTTLGKVGIGTSVPNYELTISGSLSASVNAYAAAFYGNGVLLGPGTMSSFTLAGDGGSSQAIADGNTLTVAGGTGLTSTAAATDTVSIALDNTAVSAGSYTFSAITVDAQGRLTSAASGTPSFTLAGDGGSSQTIDNGNTLTVAGGTGLTSTAAATDTVSIALDNTSVSAGSYTFSAITVDAQGRLTSAASGTPSFTLAGDSGTQTVDNGNTLTVAGGTGLTTVAAATDTVTVALDNTAVSAGSYTLASITVDSQGRLTAASNGSAGTMSSFTLAGDGGSSQPIADGNTVTVAGGTGLTTTAAATDTVTVALDNTAVNAGSYTFSAITVDAQGRLTSAASATPSFTLAADGGSSQTIDNGNTLTVAGGTGLTSTAAATDTVTLALNNTAVSAGSYTKADITVDAQGRLTSAVHGAAEVVTTYNNATDNYVLTSAGAGSINGEANLTFNGSALAVAGTLAATVANNPVAQFIHPTDNATGAVLELINSKAGNPGDADDFCGGVTFKSKDSTSVATQYSKISTKIGSPTNTSESGYMLFDVTTAGTAATTYLRLDGGTNAITSSVTTRMESDLILDATLDIGSGIDSNAKIHVSGSDSSTLAIFETPSHPLIMGITGSGQVAIGGLHLDAKLNVSGSKSDKLISLKSNTKNPAFYVSGSGETYVSGNIHLQNVNPNLQFTSSVDAAYNSVFALNSSNNILIQNNSLNKHIVLKTNDAGVIKEGFRLDGAVPEVVINQTSDSLVDFRVESDNNTHMLYVDGSADKIGINTDTPLVKLDINDNTIRIRTAGTPSSASDLGAQGEIRWDADYIYVCVAIDTWKRVAISTW